MNESPKYYFPKGGLLPQSHPLSDRARFTESYLYIPADTFSDIVTSKLPFWEKTRLWIIARPMTGFSETFAHYLMEVEAAGGSEKPEPDFKAEGVLFVAEGEIELTINGVTHLLETGGYAYIPCETQWTLKAKTLAKFHWIRKQYDRVEGIDAPEFFISSDQEKAPNHMPDCNGLWSTTRFVDPEDIRHDMHVNIVNFLPDGRIPFDETHIMEHGLYMLQGRAAYHVNGDWIDVEPGDYLWLRAFCPQSCIAKGDEPFRYLLYKDVNRHPRLAL